MKNILPFRIWSAQLKRDLIGKDSYRGVTLTYAWLANQFGHFSLGFIPAMITYFVSKMMQLEWTAFYISAGVAIAWFAFEFFNFLGPLLFFKKKQNKYTFKPPWWNVAFDTSTDVLFFAFGAFSFSIIVAYSQLNLILLITLMLLLIFPTIYWYQNKIFIQEAKFPYQFRLSQWNGDISDEMKAKIDAFLSNEDPRNHILIYGPQQTGKSSLAVGVATELAIQSHYCSYNSALKLLSQLYGDDSQRAKEWSWKNAELIIVDDINPGTPITSEVINLAHFETLILNSPNNNDFFNVLKNGKSIWVFGNYEGLNEGKKWEEMLLKFGLGHETLLKIDLNSIK